MVSARWAWPFRISATLSAFLLFDQAVFAGQFLAGTYPSLHTHRVNATYAGICVLATATCGLLLRWPGRGPWWPALASVGLFGLVAAQIAVGFARGIALHVPLGVALIAAAVLLAVAAWRYRPATAGAAS